MAGCFNAVLAPFLRPNVPMKVAIVFSVPSVKEEGFVWRWRSEDQWHESATAFSLYADCLADALGNGYAVKPVHPTGITAPRRDFNSNLS